MNTVALCVYRAFTTTPVLPVRAPAATTCPHLRLLPDHWPAFVRYLTTHRSYYGSQFTPQVPRYLPTPPFTALRACGLHRAAVYRCRTLRTRFLPPLTTTADAHAARALLHLLRFTGNTTLMVPTTVPPAIHHTHLYNYTHHTPCNIPPAPPHATFLSGTHCCLDCATPHTCPTPCLPAHTHTHHIHTHTTPCPMPAHRTLAL